jgi:hypothetical protein
MGTLRNLHPFLVFLRPTFDNQPMPSGHLAQTFTSLAPRVLMHVNLRRWVCLLGRTGLRMGGVMTAVLILMSLAGSTRCAATAIGMLLLWVIGTAIYTWVRKPDSFSALALWDQATQRNEAFAIAWWFEQQTQVSQSAINHVNEQQSLIPDAVRLLARDLPVKPQRTVWITPAITVFAIAFSLFSDARIPREMMDDDMLRAATEEAKKLDTKEWEKKKLAGLNEQEKKELEKLKESLEKTAKDLENSAGKESREVLADLEKQARDAEKLASKLGEDEENWASNQMVEEMRKHADTADLGDAVAEKKAADAAKTAAALATQLKSPQLTNEARERINESLKQIQKQADKEDRKRTVGENVLAAGDQMNQSKPAQAGDEFQKLADKMRELALREETRKELEKLAQQLRDAGSNITGQSAGGMTQMAEAGQQANDPQGSSPQVSQASPNQPGQQSNAPLQPPGMSQGQQQGQMSQTPVPGTGQTQQLPMLSAKPPGEGKDGKNGKPTLFAPVPGMKPGEKPDALMLGDNAPDGPPDGAIAMNAPGGLPPGAGTAELKNDPTAKTQSASSSTVNAQRGTEGQSTFRSVEGGTKKETASRSPTAAALDAIQAEEEALDDQALPPSRRDQVRRYFTELRKRFEKP